MSMHCELFRDHVTAALDEALDTETRAAFDAHAAECDACARLLEAQREAIGLLHSARRVTAPAALRERIVARVTAPKAVGSPWLRAAAGVLIGFASVTGVAWSVAGPCETDAGADWLATPHLDRILGVDTSWGALTNQPELRLVERLQANTKR